jgi:hypothetical protein
MKIWLLWIVLATALPLVGSGTPRKIPSKLPPVDEATNDVLLLRMRNQLASAAAAGDLNGVLRLTAPNIRVLDGWGIQKLRQEWDIDRSPKKFLDELSLVLSLGGRFEKKGTFVAPSMYIDFPDYDVVHDYRVVIHKGAPVFEHPDPRSLVIARCTWNVLSASPWHVGWTEVTLPNGKTGYMHDEDVRMPGDMRAYIEKVNGQWMLTGFYGGID